MPATLMNQTVACLQYQFMFMDVPAGKAYPVQTLAAPPNPGTIGAANAAGGVGAATQINLPIDDAALNLLMVAYETGQIIVTTTPRWVGHGATGKARDLGAAYGYNAVSGQFFPTPRPRGAYGVSHGVGTAGGTVKVRLMPY